MCGDCGRVTKDDKRAKSDVVGRFENNEYKVNSNEIPKHRRKRLTVLQNYISESEGILLTKPLDMTAGANPRLKKAVKSNLLMQDSRTKSIGNKTGSMAVNRRRNSSYQFSFRQANKQM